jgi:hypothetical protein
VTHTTLTQVTRLDEAGLTALVGSPAVENLKRKTRGGQSGFKGVRFEHLFGAHRIARLIRKLNDSGTDAEIEWQSNGFVDDFVVRRDQQSSFKGYQLKNTQQLSWTAGDPSIQADFVLQWKVSNAEGYSDIRLRLVCSDLELAGALAASVPKPLSNYSGAFYFPYGPPLLEMFGTQKWMAEDFAYLSKHPEPTRNETVEVACVLMGAWDGMCPRARVSDVWSKARDMSPTLLRSKQDDAEAGQQLTDSFRAVLDALPDFEYVILRGFLRWTAMSGSTTGVLSYDCFSDRFRDLQQHIVRLQPKSFEDIEGALI